MQRRSRNLPHQAGLLTAVDLISDCYAFALPCFALQVLPRVTQLHDKML